MGKTFTILAVGDNHCPFLHRPSADRIIEIAKSLKPDVIIDMGDKYDLLSFSRFPKRLIMTPGDELKIGREQAESFWYRLKKASPKSKRIQLKGNHDERMYKQMLIKAPELEVFINFKSYWEFEDVETIFDPKEAVEINNIIFIHGFLSKIGDHMKKFEYKNVVCGHLHRGGVVFERVSTGRTAWELNTGYIADPFSEGLMYRPSKKFFSWTHGVGLIDHCGPRFIAF